VGLGVAGKDSFRFLQVSTGEVYGSLVPTGRFTETSPYAPNSPYAASKAAADHLVRAWYHTYGLPVLTTNCSNNYGPYQFPEKLIPIGDPEGLAGRAVAGLRGWLQFAGLAVRRGPLPGHPTGPGGWASGPGLRRGGGGERTNLQVVDALCGLLDELLPDSPYRPHGRLKAFVADRPGHDRRYAIDPHKLRSELGWEPREHFESGLRRTLVWYLENQTWCRRIMDGSYRGERLGVPA